MPLTYDLESDIRFLQGKEKGKVEGQNEARREDIQALLKAGMGTPAQIASVLRVSLPFVLEIEAELTRNDS